MAALDTNILVRPRCSGPGPSVPWDRIHTAIGESDQSLNDNHAPQHRSKKPAVRFGPPRSATMLGMAVATIVASSATMAVEAMMDATTRARRVIFGGLDAISIYAAYALGDLGRHSPADTYSGRFLGGFVQLSPAIGALLPTFSHAA